MATEKQSVMKAYTIKIKSGQYAGRYVGGRFGGGLVTNPVVQNNPPVNIPGSTKYGLWTQEKAAMSFFETGLSSALEELTKLGFELDVLKIQG
ncbi:MAG TPA: hypothetical protein VN025_03835 [Candidatus Dormibacteraeota bacterium]|jgi:hypothetical protein|nr:hypothetical protein [Candidatus Dormibacteraeota bacterium]